MSCPSLEKLVKAISHLALCGILLTTISQSAYAEKADGGVCRTFIVLVNTLDQAPDLQSDQSLGLVVAPTDPLQTNLIQFDGSDCVEWFIDSTIWERQEFMHITTEGAEMYGNVYWLLDSDTPEAPPSGSITFTGPDSPFILSQEAFYYELDVTGIGYQIRCPENSPGGAGLLLLVTAVFSR